MINLNKLKNAKYVSVYQAVIPMPDWARIDLWLNNHGLSKTALANILGIKISTLAKWRTNPKKVPHSYCIILYLLLMQETNLDLLYKVEIGELRDGSENV